MLLVLLVVMMVLLVLRLAVRPVEVPMIVGVPYRSQFRGNSRDFTRICVVRYELPGSVGDVPQLGLPLGIGHQLRPLLEVAQVLDVM